MSSGKKWCVVDWGLGEMRAVRFKLRLRFHVLLDIFLCGVVSVDQHFLNLFISGPK